VAKLLTETEKDDNRRQMTGIGSTLEGFGVNRFMFEWLFEYAWDKSAANVSEWITQYARSRAGHSDPIAQDAWRRMVNTVYDQLVSGVGLGNTIEMRPRFEGNARYTRSVVYDYQELADIFGQMLLANQTTLSNSRYQYDLVMVCRQVLANLSFHIKNKVFEAYKEKNIDKFDHCASLFLEIVTDVDRIVATHPELTLNNWIAASHKLEASDAPKSYFEKNAKVLITTCGQQGSGLTDYAARDYSGLINSYYKKRWEIFFHETRKSLMDSTPFDQKLFDDKIAEFKWQWCETEYEFDPESNENPAKLARELYTKYIGYFSFFGEE
jgi:alpha-N-acetylglucosaminidase